jgi:hypothetical protein
VTYVVAYLVDDDAAAACDEIGQGPPLLGDLCLLILVRHLQAQPGL